MSTEVCVCAYVGILISWSGMVISKKEKDSRGYRIGCWESLETDLCRWSAFACNTWTEKSNNLLAHSLEPISSVMLRNSTNTLIEINAMHHLVDTESHYRGRGVLCVPVDKRMSIGTCPRPVTVGGFQVPAVRLLLKPRPSVGFRSRSLFPPIRVGRTDECFGRTFLVDPPNTGSEAGG